MPAPAWIDFPNSINAPSPMDRNGIITFRLSRLDIAKAAEIGNLDMAFEVWSVLMGREPPGENITIFNGGDVAELTSLIDAHACFQGVRRPYAEDGAGAQILTYVVNPRFFYHYEPTSDYNVVWRPVRADLVYTAHIMLDQPENFTGGVARGVFTHGAFVKADPRNARLPNEYDTRYAMRHW